MSSAKRTRKWWAKSMGVGWLLVTFAVGSVVGTLLLGQSSASSRDSGFNSRPLFESLPRSLAAEASSAPEVGKTALNLAIEATKACTRDAVTGIASQRGWSPVIVFPDTKAIADDGEGGVSFEWSFNLPGVARSNVEELEAFKMAANAAQIACQREHLDSVATAVRRHRRAEVSRLNTAARKAGECMTGNRSLALSDSDARAILQAIVTESRPQPMVAERVNRSRELQDGILACLQDVPILLPEVPPSLPR